MITALDARRVLLHLQQLTSLPKTSSPRAVQTLVDALGYVQIDSINVVERAHHLILGARLDGYTPNHFAKPLERTRGLFEHWTHDACAIPTRWFPHWKHRFARYADRVQRNAWWTSRFRGSPEATIQATLERVRREGPLRARDFEPPTDHVSQGWWEWHPEKAALEHLWRSGHLAITRRDRFEKVYDLTERVLTDVHHLPPPSQDEHHAWACREAINRLGVATAKEVAHFFHAISIDEARRWCQTAVERGDLVAVTIECAGPGRPVQGFALPAWKRLAREPASNALRLLAPFDPVIRERARTERYFNFHYRFEAFTPAAKRCYGYYVCPLLERDRLVGRVDLKFDRQNETLVATGPWWEAGLPRDASRRSRLDELLARVAGQIGAARVTLQRPTKSLHSD